MKIYIILVSTLILFHSTVLAESNSDTAIKIMDTLPTLKTSEEIMASFEALGQLWIYDKKEEVENYLKSLASRLKGTQYEPIALYLLTNNTSSDADKMKYIDRVLSETPRHFLVDDLLFKKYALLMKPYPLEEYETEDGGMITEYPSPESIGDIFAILDNLANNYNGYYFNDIGYGLMIDEQKLKDNGNGFLFYVAPQALWEKAKIYSSRMKNYKESIEVLDQLEENYPDNRILYVDAETGVDTGMGVGISAPEVNILKASIYAQNLNDQKGAANCYLKILTKYSTFYRYNAKGSREYSFVLGDALSILDKSHQKELLEKAIQKTKDAALRKEMQKSLRQLSNK